MASDQAAYDMFSSGDDSASFNQGPYNAQATSGMGQSEYVGPTQMHNSGYYNPNEHSAQTSGQPHQTYGNSQPP